MLVLTCVLGLIAAARSPAAPPHGSALAPVANFTDIAKKAGLTMQNVFGGTDTKKFIIETTGTGVAIFDYDNDGWPDIFLVNGSTLEGFPPGKAPTNHLYHNNHDGTFTDVTAQAGLAAGARACAWGITTTTAGRICTSPTTGRTGSTTTITGNSGKWARRRASRATARPGGLAARSSTTTATENSI